MSPAQFSLRLQHGITGGFMPAIPSAIHTITLAGTPTLQIQSAVRSPGIGALQDAAPKSLSVNGHEKLLDELHGILKSIPMESPPGSEDIYGMDTSIAWGSEDLEWCNQAPSGCIHGMSETKASDEDKIKFRRAVEIVKELVGEAE